MKIMAKESKKELVNSLDFDLLKDERNHYKRVAEKLEQDINNLTQTK